MTRDELIASILKQSSPKPIPVEGVGFVRVMTAYDSDQARKKLDSLKKEDHCESGRSLATVLCDEDGVLLFDIENEEHVLMLSKLPQSVLAKVLEAVNQANDAGKS